MPRQNRVNPYGELIATPAYGHFMGNRGVLHNSSGELTAKRWTHQHWIICLTEFKNRKRPLMAPGCYTELFFLDEAAALSAGHRPCAECRREDFNLYKIAWIKGNPEHCPEGKLQVAGIDKVVHAERVTKSREKVIYSAQLADLPDGSFVVLPEEPGKAYLLWQKQLYLWSPDGYGQCQSIDPQLSVSVLTPRSTVNALSAGYVPIVHTSAGSEEYS